MKGRGGASVLVPVGLFAFAFAMRTLPWLTVFGLDRIYFFGNDAYYHMRRILYALVRRPEILEFDPYLNFPHGAEAIWPPYFDQAVAALLRPFYDPLHLQGVETLAVWIPPLLGASCVLVLYGLARRHFGSGVALWAGLILGLLSGHFWYSQIGFLDHHAAVALLSTGLLAVSMELLDSLEQGRPRARLWLLGAGAAFLLSGILLVWPGALVHVAIIELAFLAFVLTRREGADALRAIALFSWVNGMAFVLVLPLGMQSSWLQWSGYSPVVLSRFQPWLFGALALHAASCALLWRRPAAGEGMAARAGLLLGSGVLVLGASLLVFPDLLEGVRDAWRWLGRGETFQLQVDESKPLFRVGDGWGGRVAELRLSRFVYLFPPALGWMVWEGRGGRGRAAWHLVIGWSLVLAALTLLQRRFFNSFSVALALVMAWSLVRAHGVLLAGRLGFSPGRAGAALLVSLALLYLLAPVFEAYRLPLGNQVELLRGRGITAQRHVQRSRSIVAGAQWLRENTPPTAGYFDPGAVPEYGVLAHWSSGHVITYVAQRPTVVGNFGDDLGPENFAASLAYFEADEEEASAMLDDLGARYVLVETIAEKRDAAYPEAAMLRRLSRDDSPDLRRHRLVFEYPLHSRAGAGARSRLRIFEHVAGAELAGEAPPGTRVRARLGYQSNRGRRGEAVSRTMADDQGRYLLRLPYATRGAPPGAVPDPHYIVSVEDGREARVVIEEEQVQRGARVRGPSF
ncbi:MAG: hypothetical protein JRG96_12335 [Deltaproteobacteria bacterium]|nr:hypothetical protein [Deltaproteobacteria bacterium]MBW2418606.1 hypothetical protein [Deltaproteobacteria bacterium]